MTLPPFPQNLPREAARAASMVLFLVWRGSSATKAETDAADVALDRLRRHYPDAARALEEWHAEAV